MVARLGGDEFAVIQTSGTDQRENAIDLAVRLLEIAGMPFHLDGHDVCIGTSIGIALAPANGINAGELLKKADLALYKVKSEGRNSFSFFEEDLSEKAITRLQLVNDMRAALSRGEFELHYQPLFEAATSRLCGMEALVRWRHPVAGLLYPDRFIGIAEETGLRLSAEQIGEPRWSRTATYVRRHRRVLQHELVVIVDLDEAPDGDIGPVVPPPSAPAARRGSRKLPQSP